MITNVLQLLSNENQYGQYVEKVSDISNEIKSKSVTPVSSLKPVNDVIIQINKSSAKEKQKPETFKVFLKKLSDRQDTDPSLAELCKKSVALKNEQEKLKAINLCVAKINAQTGKNNNENSTDDAETRFNIKHLVTLLDWITIPSKSQTKLDTLKQQLEQRKDDTDIGNLLRRIALSVSNAYMELQSELNETEGFLKKITQQLNEITLQIADIETLENESFSNSVMHNSEMEKQINLIQAGVDEADTIENIKQTINTRIEVLKTNMDQFISVEQKRKKQSNTHHNELVERLSNMEAETDKLRQCIEKEKSKAYKDALTRIPNRMAFDERISHEFQRWQRYDNKLSLCLVDIDKFKNVNDTYGHKAAGILYYEKSLKNVH